MTTASALIVVDMQNAFLDPSGGAPVPGAGAVVRAVNHWIDRAAKDARRLGYSVVVDLAASAFVHAHPEGDEAAVAELRHAGIRVLP